MDGELLKLKIFAAYLSFKALLLKTSQCCVQTTVAQRVKTQQHCRKHKRVLGKKNWCNFTFQKTRIFQIVILLSFLAVSVLEQYGGHEGQNTTTCDKQQYSRNHTKNSETSITFYKTRRHFKEHNNLLWKLNNISENHFITNCTFDIYPECKRSFVKHCVFCKSPADVF